MNPRHEKIVRLMAAYDKAAVGARERTELGQRLDWEGSRLSERDVLGAASEYAKLLEAGERGPCVSAQSDREGNAAADADVAVNEERRG